MAHLSLLVKLGGISLQILSPQPMSSTKALSTPTEPKVAMVSIWDGISTSRPAMSVMVRVSPLSWAGSALSCTEGSTEGEGDWVVPVSEAPEVPASEVPEVQPASIPANRVRARNRAMAFFFGFFILVSS